MFIKDNNRPDKYKSIGVKGDCVLRSLNYATGISYDQLAVEFGVAGKIDGKTQVGYSSDAFKKPNVVNKLEELGALVSTRRWKDANAKVTVKKFGQWCSQNKMIMKDKKDNWIIFCQSPTTSEWHCLFMTSDGDYIDIEDSGDFEVQVFIEVRRVNNMNESNDNAKVPRLLIIRGLPGSGKSTTAKKLSQQFNVAHFENDAYLMHDGKYMWTPETAKEAARKCFEDTMSELRSGRDAIVSNVFVTVKAVNKYANAAKHLGVRVMVMRMTGDYGNVHDVPAGTLRSMKNQFEDYPGELVK